MANPTTSETATRKRKAPVGPKVSKFILLYEADSPVKFDGLFRGMSAEAFEAMSRANSEGRKLQSHTFEIASKPGAKTED